MHHSRTIEFGWAIALVITGASCIQVLGSAQPAFAEEGETLQQGFLGLCALGDASAGRWIHNGNGEMIPLRQICDDPNGWAHEVTSPDRELSHLGTESRLRPEAMLTSEQEFWLRFHQAASPEALEFVRSLDSSAVLAYGQTLCPLLNRGVTMDEVRDTQIEADLPADFDAAVNVAAIHAYCPQHVTQIGR